MVEKYLNKMLYADKHSKNNKYIKMAKGTIGLGVTNMAGGAVLGSMGSLPGMPAQANVASSTAMGAMNLAAVGNLAHIGMNIMPKGKKMKKGKKFGY